MALFIIVVSSFYDDLGNCIKLKTVIVGTRNDVEVKEYHYTYMDYDKYGN